MNDNDSGLRDHASEARDAERLRTRIAAVMRRAARVIPVQRADGTIFLRGRRRSDRNPDVADRRGGERRRT